MPPKPDEACEDCGRHLARCICESVPQGQRCRRTPSERAADRAAELKRIKAEATANHCSHGVALDHCRENHPTEEAPE